MFPVTLANPYMRAREALSWCGVEKHECARARVRYSQAALQRLGARREICRCTAGLLFTPHARIDGKMVRLPPLDLLVSNIMVFCDERHGFVGHEASNIYYTCDGGLTWEARLPTRRPFRFVGGLISACGVVPP